MAKRKRVTAHALAKHLQDELNASEHRHFLISEIVRGIPHRDNLPHAIDNRLRDIYNLSINAMKGKANG